MDCRRCAAGRLSRRSLHRPAHDSITYIACSTMIEFDICTPRLPSVSSVCSTLCKSLRDRTTPLFSPLRRLLLSSLRKSEVQVGGKQRSDYE